MHYQIDMQTLDPLCSSGVPKSTMQAEKETNFQ